VGKFALAREQDSGCGIASQLLLAFTCFGGGQYGTLVCVRIKRCGPNIGVHVSCVVTARETEHAQAIESRCRLEERVAMCMVDENLL